jgi:hypothetical protein
MDMSGIIPQDVVMGKKNAMLNLIKSIKALK